MKMKTKMTRTMSDYDGDWGLVVLFWAFSRGVPGD
jgi:hypothetical protein